MNILYTLAEGIVHFNIILNRRLNKTICVYKWLILYDVVTLSKAYVTLLLMDDFKIVLRIKYE